MENDRTSELMDHVRALHRESQALASRLAAVTSPDRHHWASDGTRLVEATVDGRGRAVDVRIKVGFTRSSDDIGLAGAVVESVTAANNERLLAWGNMAAVGVSEAPDELPSPGDLIGLIPPSATGDKPPVGAVSGASLVRALLPMLEAAERQIDGAISDYAAQVTAGQTISTEDGGIEAYMQGGVVTQVAFARGWIARHGADEIGRQLCRLLQEGHDRQWEAEGALPYDLASVMAIAADPARLLRQFGLTPKEAPR